MRHAARKNFRNGAIVLGCLCVGLLPAAYLATRAAQPEFVTVVRYLPGESCAAVDRAPRPEDSLIDRILHPHRRRAQAAHAPAANAAPPLVCTPADVPVTRRGGPGGDDNAVDEPSTLALLALAAVPLVAARRRA